MMAHENNLTRALTLPKQEALSFTLQYLNRLDPFNNNIKSCLTQTAIQLNNFYVISLMN